MHNPLCMCMCLGRAMVNVDCVMLRLARSKQDWGWQYYNATEPSAVSDQVWMRWCDGTRAMLARIGEHWGPGIVAWLWRGTCIVPMRRF